MDLLLADIIQLLEDIAPPSLAEEWTMPVFRSEISEAA